MVSLANVRKRSGFGLIEILVVIVIISILAALLLPRLLGGTGLDGKKHRSPIQRAKDVANFSYTSQIQQAIMMYKQDNESYPPNLQALRKYGLTDEMMIDANTKQPIPYDPRTGKIGPEALVTLQGQPPQQPGAPGQPAPPPGPPGPPGRAGHNGTTGPGGVFIPTIPSSSVDAGGGDD